MKNNYNFGVVKLHLKFNQRTVSTPHEFQTCLPNQNLILFQPDCDLRGLRVKMNKKWKIYEVVEEKVEEISNKYHVNKLLATILANRNIVNEEEIRLFLNPTRNDFHDPYLMTDMEKAINRIVEAIEKQEK